MKNYEEIVDECKKEARYGDLWKEFSTNDLISYGYIKAKRGEILYNRGNVAKAIDDIKDAINILIFSIQKIEYDADKGEK